MRSRTISVSPAISRGTSRSLLWVAAAPRPRLATWKSFSSGSGMPKLAVVDAGPLYAAADSDDVDHRASVEALSRAHLRLVVPSMVVAEATYFVGRRLGAAAEAAFLRGVGTMDVEAPSPDDFA